MSGLSRNDPDPLAAATLRTSSAPSPAADAGSAPPVEMTRPKPKKVTYAAGEIARLEGTPDLWQALANKLPTASTANDRRRRKALFDVCDLNGNGLCSLAEIDRGLLVLLAGGNGADPVVKAKPIILRAFNAAKNLSGADSGPAASYVQFAEFRALLQYIRQYFECWVMLAQLDSAAGDNRLSLGEFQQALVKVRAWGVEAGDAKVAATAAAYSVINSLSVPRGQVAFRELDNDVRGKVRW